MSLLTLLIILFTLPLLMVRLLRWLGWVQQKEYRVDRLWQFLLSEEGLHELIRLMPQKRDFSRTGLKRPVITFRSGVVSFLSLILLGYILSTAYFLHWWWLPLLSYLLMPLFPGLAAFITEVFKNLVSISLLFAAQKKLAVNHPKILGITGSYGKTTTRHLVTHVLSQQFTIFTPPKSHNTPVSIAWSLLRNYRQQALVFLEYAAYKKGEIKRLAKWFPPTISLVTGVTEQHLALFGSLEKIIKAKGELVKATQLDGQVFYNGNDEQVIQVCDQDSSKPRQAYSGPESTIKVSKASLDKKGRLGFVWEGKTTQTHLVGLHNLEAIQAAIAIAQYLQVPKEKIRSALVSFLPTENYIQVYSHSKQQFLIINDGQTSNPKGFLAALAVLEHFQKTGKNTVLVTSGILDLGDESDAIHLKLAKAAQEICDVVLYTGVDGRHVFREVFGSKMTDKQKTIQLVIDKLSDSDVLLIEGNIPKWLQRQLEKKV